MANQPAMGLQLALLGRDASTAEQETVMIDEFVTDIREFSTSVSGRNSPAAIIMFACCFRNTSVCYFVMLTYIINIMYFSPLLVILYLGSDVPMKLKVVFLLFLPWSLRWTVINLLEKLSIMLYYQWISASRPHVQGTIEVTRFVQFQKHKLTSESQNMYFQINCISFLMEFIFESSCIIDTIYK
ncbi:hypothetical protein Hanom_Chr02g00118001 [Helianthus anomalus]